MRVPDDGIFTGFHASNFYLLTADNLDMKYCAQGLLWVAHEYLALINQDFMGAALRPGKPIHVYRVDYYGENHADREEYEALLLDQIWQKGRSCIRLEDCSAIGHAQDITNICLVDTHYR